MWMAPIRSGLVDQKMSDYEDAMNDWHGFVNETEPYYGVDMRVLTKPFAEEQRKYYLKMILLCVHGPIWISLEFLRLCSITRHTCNDITVEQSSSKSSYRDTCGY